MILLCVSDLEVEPLIVSASIDVILQDQIVGFNAPLITPVDIQKIAALEIRIKN